MYTRRAVTRTRRGRRAFDAKQRSRHRVVGRIDGEKSASQRESTSPPIHQTRSESSHAVISTNEHVRESRRKNDGARAVPLRGAVFVRQRVPDGFARGGSQDVRHRAPQTAGERPDARVLALERDGQRDQIFARRAAVSHLLQRVLLGQRRVSRRAFVSRRAKQQPVRPVARVVVPIPRARPSARVRVVQSVVQSAIQRACESRARRRRLARPSSRVRRRRRPNRRRRPSRASFVKDPPHRARGIARPSPRLRRRHRRARASRRPRP